MKMMFRRLLLNSSLALAACSFAGATTITYNTASSPATTSIPDTTTNFTLNVSVPLFNPSVLCTAGDICTLNSISVSLTGDVLGNASFESKDAAPATITTDVAANLKLTTPGGATIVISLPDFTTSTSVTAYDGITDFGGTSGKTFTSVSATDTENSGLLTTPAYITLFTGSGNLSLPVIAKAASNANGAGNLVTSFATQAGASVQVTYDFIDTPSALASTPEPASFALFGGALLAIGMFRRRAVR